MKLFKTLAVSAAVALASTSGAATAGTLQDVQARGELELRGNDRCSRVCRT